MANLGTSLNDILEERIWDRFAPQRDPFRGMDDELRALAESSVARNIQLSDPEVLKDTVRDTLQSYTMMAPDEAVVSQIASEASARERANKVGFAESQARVIDSIIDRAQTVEGTIFFQSLGTLLGRRFQIPDQDWSRFAGMMTGDHRLENNQQNQDDVLNRFVGQVYADTGSWEQTFRVFHSIVGNSGANLISRDPMVTNPWMQDEPNPLDRQLSRSDVVSEDRMTNAMLVEMADQAETYWEREAASGTDYSVSYSFDAAAHAQRAARAAGRAKHQAWQYHDRAQHFFDMMSRESPL